MKHKKLAFIAVSGVLILPACGMASMIDPASYSATIGVGETISINKTVTTDASGASRADVFLLADNTGSMGGIINTAQSKASDLLNADYFKSRDVAFGVGRYFGDPSEGLTGDSSYDVLQSVTSDKTSVQNAIDGWIASGGGDGPEANLYALQQLAASGAAGISGVGSGEATGWRAGSQRIAAWFGDASGHQATVDLAESISALQEAGVTVVGFNSRSSGAGIDGSYDETGNADLRNQASAIADATGGSLTNNFSSLDNDEFVNAIVDSITDAASTFDLIFGTDGDTSGLSLAFACTDSRGCDNVRGGESRSFRLDITGMTPGTYDFSTFARGIGAVENDTITVTASGPGDGDDDGSTPVDEPSTVLLFALSLLALGLGARFQRNRGTSGHR